MTLPTWLKKPLYGGTEGTEQLLRDHGVNTVCEEARCPNRQECFHNRRATFLLLGSVCTRACAFCAIGHSKHPGPVDPFEPERVAKSTLSLGLRSVVLTMVTRDDLSDGGASHVVRTLQEVRSIVPGISCELLTSDFDGNFVAAKLLLNERPEVFGHNVETVRRLCPTVRSKATYERSLLLLSTLKRTCPQQVTKSGFMVGLGETRSEVYQTLLDLAEAGVDVVTIGQYLQPSTKNHLVVEWIHPTVFKEYEVMAKELKFREVLSGPFVRSSYRSSISLVAKGPIC